MIPPTRAIHVQAWRFYWLASGIDPPSAAFV